MSTSSKKSRRQLRRVWQQSNQENLSIEDAQQLSFVQYKHTIDWQPQVQKGWDPNKKTKTPHEQGR